ncbi:LOW QUALITY PROTEIN: hypothetical protein Cgig2_013342 [Carnegiea gigantea]|uniref:Ubiquitin-like protease family profile domain-containing protein n=1 Tax=Carnegiea gigantea TaxID=171969 RepID=A0A9Q1JIL5_9CARY|nr:LOW QUALITY PROTEIN: hypothetical protein Cgig2_013342 [Carnegiea gigantea]
MRKKVIPGQDRRQRRKAIGDSVPLKGEKGKCVSIRGRCILECIVSMNYSWTDYQREAVMGTILKPILKYHLFAMERNLVVALVKCWVPRSIQASRQACVILSFNVALLTGALATEEKVDFSDESCTLEIANMVMGRVHEEEQQKLRRRKLRKESKDSGVYKNFISAMVCEQSAGEEQLDLWLKLFMWLVLSGLMFPRSVYGAAWNYNGQHTNFMIKSILHPHEEELEEPIAWDFIEMDEFRYYVEEGELRHVHATLREEKDAHAATCAELESCKAHLSEVRAELVGNDGNATEEEQEGEILDAASEVIHMNTRAVGEDVSEFGVENVDNDIGTLGDEGIGEGADEDTVNGQHVLAQGLVSAVEDVMWEKPCTRDVDDGEEAIATPAPEKEMTSGGRDEVHDVKGGDVEVGYEEGGSSSCIAKHLKRTVWPRRAAPSWLPTYTNPRGRRLLWQRRHLSAVRDYLEGLVHIVPNYGAGVDAAKYFIGGFAIDCTQVFMPFHEVEGKHWLLFVADLREKCYLVYNSATSLADEHKEALVHSAVRFKSNNCKTCLCAVYSWVLEFYMLS